MKYNPDDIFANVMYVSFHRCHEYFPVGMVSGIRFFCFNKGCQPTHGFFHDAGRFDHLREKHLATAEEVANNVHAIHQWAFNDIQWSFDVQPGFFGIGFDKFGNAFYQCVF